MLHDKNFRMDYPKYAFRHNSNLDTFAFESEGKNGVITKIVQIIEIEDDVSQKRFYNLSLADYKQGAFDFNSITDNRDTKTVFGSIASIVRFYTEAFPDRKVLITGSTRERSRLYQIHISNNIDEILKQFWVFGKKYDSTVFVEFNKNETYQTILVESKKTFNFKT